MLEKPDHRVSLKNLIFGDMSDHFLDTILDTPNPLPQYSMPNTIGIVPIPPNRVSRMGPESAPKVVKK